MFVKQLVVLALVALLGAHAAFDIYVRPRRDVFASDKKWANYTFSDTKWSLVLGRKADGADLLKLTPTINLNDALTYVYASDCEKDKCRKGDPPPEGFRYTVNEDDKRDPKGVPGDTFKVNRGENKEIKGVVYKTEFTAKNSDSDRGQDIKFTGAFGLVTKLAAGSTEAEAPDFAIGLGFEKVDDKDENSKLTPLVKSIFESPNFEKKGIVIQSREKGKGYIVFGANEDANCTNLIQVDAQKGGPGTRQKWWVKFDKVETEKKSDNTNTLAEFDFDLNEILLPSELAQNVGTESVPDLGKLKPITFTLGGKQIKVFPEQYTEKDGKKFKPLVNTNARQGAAHIVLGVPFLRNRCIILHGDDFSKPKISISQLPDPPKKDNGVGQIQLSLAAAMFSALSLLGMTRLV